MTESHVPKVYPPINGEATLEFNDPRETKWTYGDSDEYWMIWNNYFDLRLKEDGTGIVSASRGEGEGMTYEYTLDEEAIDKIQHFISMYKKGGLGWQS